MGFVLIWLATPRALQLAGAQLEPFIYAVSVTMLL